MSTVAEAAFLKRIIAEPDQDLPRLQYADWLDEHGQPERAEFIRVQIQVAGWQDICGHHDDSRRNCPGCGLRRRERELPAAHDREWANDPLRRDLDRVRNPVDGSVIITDRRDGSYELGEKFTPYAFRRGFVSEVTLSWPDWQAHAAALLAACPIRRVNRLRACDRCGGGIARRVLDAVAYDPCPACRGTGRVDDWRGDGLVRLTTMPTMETRGERFSDRQDRLAGCETWYWRRADRSPNWSAPNDDDTPDRRMIRGLLAAEYPGVPFEVPADGPRSEPTRNLS